MTASRGPRFERMEAAILDAAADLFHRQGFNQTSLQDIADSLGMARPSLYHYFENREQILAAGIDSLTARRNELLEQLARVSPDPVDRLEYLVHGLGRLVVEHPLWVGILLNDAGALPDEARERDADSRLAYFDALTAAIRAGIDGGRLRPVDEQAAALMVISALSGLQGDYVAAESASTEHAELLATDIILRGILDSEPGTGSPLERGMTMIEDGLALVRNGIGG